MALGAATRQEPIVAVWDTPIHGVINGIQDLKIPTDALYLASNAELVDGVLRNRAGLNEIADSIASNPPVGALNFWNSSTASYIILATTNAVWTALVTAPTLTWTSRSGTLTGGIDNPARIIQFSFGTPPVNWAYITNGIDPMVKWKVADASVTVVAGSPPIFNDITIVGDRIMGIVGSNSVQWGEILTDATWPANNVKLFARPSPLTAIGNLGLLGVVVYAKDSINVGMNTGLTGGSAFKWQDPLLIEGPANPAALVDAAGAHVYMTKTGRVGLFTGVSHDWIADGVWPIIKAEIDYGHPNRIFGVYDPTHYNVRFYYKRIGQTVTDGLLVVNIGRPKYGLPYSAWPGRHGTGLANNPMSASAACTIFDDVLGTNIGALVFGSQVTQANSHSYAVDYNKLSDNGVPVDGYIQTGVVFPNLHPLAHRYQVTKESQESMRALSLETFLGRNAAWGRMTVKLVLFNALTNINGTQTAGQTIDLTQTPVKQTTGFPDARGRAVALRYEWEGDDVETGYNGTVHYRGAILRGSETP